jgi:hypothetical protein
MSSQRRIMASRANARASTGPKTVEGRRRSARNAFQHGLSLPLYSDPACSEQVATLAREIAGPISDAEIQKLACHVAEAQIDLCRVRDARHQLLSQALGDVSCSGLPGIERLVVLPRSIGSDLLQRTNQLMRLDRYEQRALSRCKAASRAFDEARRKGSASD